MKSRTDNRYGVLGSGSLEEMVDPGNIHGWLQEKVRMVENRLAYAVTALTEPDPERLVLMKEADYEYGKRNSLDKDAGVREAYDYLENTLLNGMPCDRVNELVQETENSLVWKQTKDIHEAYWNVIHGDPGHYYALRESLIKGMLEYTGIEFQQIDDQVFELRRRL